VSIAGRPHRRLIRRALAHHESDQEIPMRKLIVSEFISLDGVIQAPGGPDEDRDGGFAHGGWTVPYWHDDIGGAFSR
jgi:acyl-coenzyme A thioesterase PaaI-like protein